MIVCEVESALKYNLTVTAIEGSTEDKESQLPPLPIVQADPMQNVII
jgi:hypothetical protein